jgi:DNA helicase-2/ATP-dependent DNA helicase PcrA
VPEPDDLLSGLDDEQREVATTSAGVLRVLAGAGTGKTRAITHRIAYAVAGDVVGAGEVLAVTFTTRAAGELRVRLAGLGITGVQARTFHSAALRQARFFWPQVYGTELPPLVDSKLSMVSEAARRIQTSTSRTDLRDLAGEIEWAKVSNVAPDAYARLATEAGRRLAGIDAGTVGHIYRAYEDVKTDRRCIDMEDTLLCAVAVLGDDERVAAQFRRQYRWFVVDEFQDVSPVQFALLRLWMGSRSDLCVVGDPAQTIYSFAGADPRLLRDLPRTFKDTTTLELVRNYRSTPEVLAVANAVMRGELGHGAVELRPTRSSGAAVSLQGYRDEVDEAAQVADQIEKLVADGVAPSDVAVLFRINAMSENYEDELTKRAIPFVLRGAERFFERPEVREALAHLRVAARRSPGSEPPEDAASPTPGSPPMGSADPGSDLDEPRNEVMRGPGASARVDQSLVDDVRAVLGDIGWTSAPPDGRGRARDRWESLQALVGLAEDQAAGSGLAAFVAELEQRATSQHAPDANGVTLATLHTGKGLEWPVVFLVGVADGSIPISYADTPEAVAEERRLLYVGVTRARDRLSVSWAAARSPGGRSSRTPSRFLLPLLDPATVERPSRRSRDRRSAVPHCRVCGRPLADPRERKLARCADCPVDYDEGLYESLREWRRGRAAAEKVPAYCVFTDATLTALAEMRPGDPAGLLRVPGIGASKVERYGGDVLALISASPAPTGHD